MVMCEDVLPGGQTAAEAVNHQEPQLVVVSIELDTEPLLRDPF